MSAEAEEAGPPPDEAARGGATAERAAAGALWTAIGNWGNQLLTLAVFTVLARLLVPADFGVVAFASVFLALVKVLAEQGMADAVVQRHDLRDVHLDTAFWSSAVGGLLLAAGLGGASWVIADLVERPDVAPVLAALSVSIAIAGLGNVQRGVLTRALDFRGLALRSLASSLGGGIVGVVMAVSGFGVWSLVGQTVAFEAFGVATLWAASPWRPRRRFSRQAAVEMGRFGVGVVGFKVLNFFNTRSDNFVIGLFLGAQLLGFYVIAYRLLQLLMNVTIAIVGTVAFPLFSRVQRDPRAVAAVYYRVLQLTALLAFPAFTGVMIIAPDLVRLVFGPDWDRSVPVVRVLAVAGIIQSVVIVHGTVMKALGRPELRVWITALNSALNVAAFLVAVRWGIVGVAGAYAAVTLAVGPVWWLTARRLIPLRLGTALQRLRSPLICTLLMALVVVGLELALGSLAGALQLAVLVPVGVAVYGGALRLLDRGLYEEALRLGVGALRGLKNRSAPA